MASPSDLFIRNWSVAIGPDGGQGRKWEGLRTTFRIEKSGSSTPNKVEVAIYNLSADSRSFIKKGHIVQVSGGYGQAVKLLGQGEIALPNHAKEGADWVTRLEADDGGKALRTTLSESFGPKTTESAIIRAIAKKLGVKLGKLQGLSDSAVGRGRQLSGPAKHELDALCKSRGLRWSIQDGVLQVLPIGEPLNGEAVLLSPSTGLVGSPELTAKGVKVTSLLQGGINPGHLIKVESLLVTGEYVAEKVTIEGDSHGDAWYTHIEALKRS